MTRDALLRVSLRGIAFTIALAATIDPAISSDRPARRIVLVSAGDAVRDARLADEVSKALRGQFTVTRTPIAGASAAVIVGDLVPQRDETPTPSFVVVPDSTEPRVVVTRIELPSSATLDERIPVRTLVAIRGAARGRSLEVVARVGGAIVDRVTRRVSADTTLSIPMSFVPAALGPVTVRVSANLDGVDSPALADAALNVVNERRAVLFYDPRPSWISTFVRRSVEHDPRFSVSSRTLTSRNVGTEVGRPPAALGGGDWTRLASFDVVVIGAPQLLSTADVAGLDAFMRRRGGSVVFLLDEAATGPYQRLARTTAWSASRGSPTTFTLARSDSATLRSSEVVVPANLPVASTVIAGEARPVVWETPVGAGRLVVSGALDAWRFRDPAASTFDRFWRMVIADAAASAPPPLVVEPAAALVKPGETVDVHATVRDVALDSSAARVGSMRASLAAATGRETPIRTWPEGEAGRFRATIRAPQQHGAYRLTVASGARVAELPIVVSADARVAPPEPTVLASAWAASRGGRLFQASEIGKLPAALNAAVRPALERTTWHPFRSAWWIVPFVLALSIEWWLRRRQGLR